MGDELKEIISGCCAGEIKAQERLYKLYYNYGMSIAVRYANNWEMSGEIYNDSFLKVFQNIKNFDQQKNFKSWLRQIIINTAIDHYRREMKFNNQVEISGHENFVNLNGTIEHLLAEDIIRLIHSLPSIYRIVFNLYELEGYTHNEISSRLNISESTSRSCLSRAKNKLRLLIAEKYDTPK